MDVGPVSPGPAGMNLSRVPGQGAPAATSGIPARGDAAPLAAAIDAAVFGELSAPDVAKLIGILELPQLSANVAQADNLVRAAVSAAAEGAITQAFGALTQALKLDPLRAEAIRSEPGLEPIRPQIDQFLNRLMAVARLDAEGRLSRAVQLLEALGAEKLADWDARPETLILIANRLLDSGGHANYLRTADLSQAFIDAASRGLPAITNVPVPFPVAAEPVKKDGVPRGAIWRVFGEVRKQAPSRTRALWRRAPLLILLLAWLGLGTVAGLVFALTREFWPPSLIDSAFKAWGLGFLVLVIIGFYARIRNVRLR
jgi:hypothetical protein